MKKQKLEKQVINTAQAVTEEIVQEWKKQHGEVLKFTACGFQIWVRTPTRNEIKYATSLAAADPLEFPEQILKDCFLGGDKKALDHNGFFMSVSVHIDDLVGVKEATLEKC